MSITPSIWLNLIKMKQTEIEKLNQFISRSDMTGKEKVKWLTEFIDNMEFQLQQPDVIVRSEHLLDFIQWYNEHHPEKYIPNSRVGNYLQEKSKL